MAETLQETKKKAGRKKHRAGRIVLAVLGVLILAIVITDVVVCHHRSDPDHIQAYDTQNPYVLEQTDISGHRSGGGIEPEETLRAFKNCAENPDFSRNSDSGLTIDTNGTNTMVLEPDSSQASRTASYRGLAST